MINSLFTYFFFRLLPALDGLRERKSSLNKKTQPTLLGRRNKVVIPEGYASVYSKGKDIVMLGGGKKYRGSSNAQCIVQTMG